MPHDTGWFKSSHSAGSNNDCVEVRITGTRVGVRDSKNPDGPHLVLPATAWVSFLAKL